MIFRVGCVEVQVSDSFAVADDTTHIPSLLTEMFDQFREIMAISSGKS